MARRSLSLVLVAAAWLLSGCSSQSPPPPAAAPPGPAAAPQARPAAPPAEPPAPAGQAAGAAAPSAAALAAVGVPRLDPGANERLGLAVRQRARALNNEGMTLYRAGDFAKAAERFRKALRLNPGHVLARYNLACNLCLLAEPEPALTLLGELAAQPECPACRRQLLAAARDEDFRALRGDPRFERLLPQAPRVLLGLDETALKRDDELRFRVEGLPAISADGRRVALALQRADGLRGHPNLELQILAPGETKPARRRVILAPEELQDSFAALAQPVRVRLTQANQLLAESVWEPLPPALLADGSRCAPAPRHAQLVHFGAVQLRYDEPKLQVLDAAGAILREQDLSSWAAPGDCLDDPLPPPGQPCRAACVNPGVLDQAHYEPERGVLLFKVVYCGDHACPPPDERWGLLRLR